LAIFNGILSLLAALFCFYAPRSQWARRRYEAKFGDRADEEQARYIRLFRHFGYAWLVLGLLYLLTA